jgi:DNA-binding MarR family transcriptional regulator
MVRLTKRDRLIKALRQRNGTTITALEKTLGWKPHSVRAALTGLRKQGYRVERDKVDDTTRYRIIDASRRTSS